MTEWGHSFRPAYLRLARAIERLGRPTVLALTATATPWIRREIVERLGLRDPAIVVRDVDLPRDTSIGSQSRPKTRLAHRCSTLASV